MVNKETMSNKELRRNIKANNLTYSWVARELNISDQCLYSRLSRPVSVDFYNEVMELIKRRKRELNGEVVAYTPDTATNEPWKSLYYDKCKECEMLQNRVDRLISIIEASLSQGKEPVSGESVPKT